MLEWIQQNWEILAAGGGGGTIVGLVTQLREWASDNDDAESEFRSDLIKRVNALEGRCDALTRQQSRMSQRIIELSQERDALSKQLRAVEERANHAERTVEELRGKIDAKNREIDELQTRLRKLEDRSEPTL